MGRRTLLLIASILVAALGTELGTNVTRNDESDADNVSPGAL